MPERRLIVATSIVPGHQRLATKEEKCQHWWIPKSAWSSGGRHHRCAFCPATKIVRKDEDGDA